MTTAPAPVLAILDHVSEIDTATRVLLENEGAASLPNGALRVLMNFGITAARTMDDLLALYPDMQPDHDEEEIWHQASL